MLKMIFGLTKKFQILIYNTIMQQYPIKAIIYSLSKVREGLQVTIHVIIELQNYKE
jgi:hypothetical protein